ncbi:hypothetical protein Tco_1064840, partial [Tanacetum coccineum]
LQALLDKKKVIITESTIRRDLQLEDAEGVDCLPNATIFEELTRMGAKTTAWNKFSSIIASAIICLATNQKFNFSKYIFDNMVKNVDSMGKFLMYPSSRRNGKTDPHHIPIITQPSISQPQKKQPRRKQRKDTEVPQPSGPTEPIADKTANVESVPTHSNDPLLSGEDRLELNELIELCTTLQSRVLALETTKTAQAQKITSLIKRVKKLERRKKSRTWGLKRLFMVGLSARIDSSNDEASLGDQEDASKHESTTVSAAIITEVDITLAKALAELKSVKPKVVTTVATTTTTAVTRPKDKGLVIQEQEQASIPSILVTYLEDKGKGIMVEEPEKMKKKDQVLFDQQEAIRLQAQFDEKERTAREKEEANAALIAQWNDIQDEVETDYELA